MALKEEWAKKLAELKAAWGIIGNDIDKKLDRLLVNTDGNPTVEQLAAMIRSHISPGGIDTALLHMVSEWKDLLKTGKSPVVKNRSSLA